MKLWDYYNGEPFMENPHLAVIGNPFKVGSIIERKKQGFRKISQRKGKSVMAYKRRGKKNSPKRRRRSRKNPFPVAGVAINRPRRRRRAKVYSMTRNRRGVYRHNPKRHHRRHKRNPSAPAIFGITLPPFNMIAWGAGGFIATPMLETFAQTYVPTSITSNVLGRYALKIGSVLGLTWLAKTVMSHKEAFAVGLGGSLYVVVSAVHEFLPSLTGAGTTTTPPAAVHAYRSGMINAYRGGMIATGIGSYARTGLAQHPRALPGLAFPSSTMPQYDMSNYGMLNPVFADPRFTNSPFVAR